ncbi:MAG: hypothetical protein HYR56_29065 [Acidobacteria bacterium]|nr:hypothetical protein [Acidobacteriota bacterium]MBI3426027.1 hypothetical protein [Acidobacteriota bacterium]
MNKFQKAINIALACFIVLLLLLGEWKETFIYAALLLSSWLGPKELQLSKPAKVIGFGLAFILLAFGCVFLWQDLRKH